MKLRKALIAVLTGSIITSCAFALPVSAANLGDRLLQAGMTGEDVRNVQTQLKRLGYTPGPEDGLYGKATQDAVMAFQKEKKLGVDGIVGDNTLGALREKKAMQTSRGQAPIRYEKVHNIVATAYAPGPADNGRWGNLTHIGTNVRPGIIAVDPQVIPLGKRVYIEFADGQGTYAVAEDTGGAIKGNRVDIAFQTRAEAKNFGIQNVKIYVLD